MLAAQRDGGGEQQSTDEIVNAGTARTVPWAGLRRDDGIAPGPLADGKPRGR